MATERSLPIQKLADQTSTSVRWANELRSEQPAPTFIFRIPKTPAALEKAFGLAVFFTLTNDRLVRREYEEIAAAAPSESIEVNLLDLFHEAMDQRQKGQFQREFDEAKTQGKKAAQEVFDRFGVRYGVHYDYWQGMYRIGRSVNALAASNGDNDHLFITAPVSNLGGIEGIPNEVVDKKAKFGRDTGGSRREAEQSPGYEELAQVVEKFGYTREQMQKALMGDSLYSHATKALGFDRVMSLLNHTISSYYGLSKVERRQLMDNVINMLSEEELSLLEQPQEHFLIAEFVEPIEAGNQRGLATLKFNVGNYTLRFDRQTRQLVGIPFNEHQVSEVEFFVNPTVTDETTHQGLMALRQKGLERATSLGL